jgi:hypothetical protein
MLLYFRRRSLARIGVWIAAAVASTILYFHNFDFPFALRPHFVFRHPLFAIKFFLFLVGDMVGENGTSSAQRSLVMVVGLGVVLLAVTTVLLCGLRRDERGSSPIGTALICFGLLFAATVTEGRASLRYPVGGASRYATFDLLNPIGIYLALLGRAAQAHAGDKAGQMRWTPHQRSRVPLCDRRTGGVVDRVAIPCALVLILVAIAVQIPFGIDSGIRGGEGTYAVDVQAAKVLKNIDHSSNEDVFYDLDDFANVALIRELAQVLEQHRLSVFADR